KRIEQVASPSGPVHEAPARKVANCHRWPEKSAWRLAMAGGRPSKLTPELQEAICKSIREGNCLSTACRCARISYRTFRNWMVKGRKAKKGQFRQFFQAIDQAEAESEAAAVKAWQSQIPRNWQAAMHWLARRFPERWSPQAKEIADLRRTLTELGKVVDGGRLPEGAGAATGGRAGTGPR